MVESTELFKSASVVHVDVKLVLTRISPFTGTVTIHRYKVDALKIIVLEFHRSAVLVIVRFN